MIGERIKKLREQVIKTKPEICAERALIVTEAYKNFASEDISILRARTLEKVLNEMSIYILPGELIVGNHSSKLRAAPVFPEFDVKFLEDEIDDFVKRSGDPFLISEEDKRRLLGIVPFWKGKTIKEKNMAMWPEENKLAGQGFVGVIDNEWSLENSDGHLAIDYPKLINSGLKSVISETKNYLGKLDISEPEDLEKKYFYESVIIAANAVIKFAHRYSTLAADLAGEENNSERKAELKKISEICKKIPEYPADTFWEALQSIWFLQLCVQIDANGHSISIGRFDQFMYPLYENDIKENVSSREEIYELCQSFWIKLASLTKLRSWSQTRLNAGYPMFQNLTIGGQNINGQDACNDLTYMCLDVTDSLRLFQPAFTARVHRNSPREYLKRIVDLLSEGISMPSLYNDEIIIPALLNRGVKKEDAYDYCLVGCAEPSVQGKWGGRYGACIFNLAKCLELALNNGRDPKTGIQLRKGKGDLNTFSSYDELYNALIDQIKYFVREHVIRDNIQDIIWERYLPTPLISCLVGNCLKRGKEIKKGGAVYDYTGGTTGGVATVANSLAAIKKLIFDEHIISTSELKIALDNNFAGPEGERLRQILINKTPKYGNDDDYVDNIAKDIFSVLLKEVNNYHNTRYGKGPIGGSFHHSTVSTAANVPFGMIVGALPSGRKEFTPVSDTESPEHGTEFSGPTAILSSVSKLEHLYESGGAILNIKFTPSLFKNERNKYKLVDLIRAYFELRGMQVQINMISADTLKDAQKNPDNYRDLIIRVAGYSAYFVDLDYLVQNDIIERTELMEI